MQRLRITFSRSGRTSYLSHLEMMKSWERVFRRAGWPVAHSQGFNPHPRIFFAAPLAVGVAAEQDIMEVHLEAPVDPESAGGDLQACLPPGLSIVEVVEIDAEALAVQKAIRAAEYLAECPNLSDRSALRAEADRVIAAASVPRERVKDTKTVRYDLRPFIQQLEVMDGDAQSIRMRLRNDAQGAGRADEVLRELGLDPAECRITRTRLVLEH